MPTCSTPCSHDSCGRKRAHFANTTRLQDPRARVQRRARRAHIVHQHHNRAPERRRMAGRLECAPHVATAFGSGQSGLCPRGPHAPQGGADGQSEPARQVGRLVEPALATPRRMKRHRHDRAGAVQEIGASFAHQSRERAGQRSTPVVLEREDDGTERAIVVANRAHPIERPVDAPATHAAVAGRRRRPLSPRTKWIAAKVAARRCEWKNRTPAGRAHGAGRRAIEQYPAGRAHRREDDREQRVKDGAPRARRFPRGARARRTSASLEQRHGR